MNVDMQVLLYSRGVVMKLSAQPRVDITYDWEVILGKGESSSDLGRY